MLQSGSFPLFRFLGIQVYLHWSWFLMAFYVVSTRKGIYVSPVWNIAEYLALFAIVLTHEYGHALACRQVGGRADRIVLWPLGGIAFVDPPNRAGAMLWSIAAGPLVNVILVPVLYAIDYYVRAQGLPVSADFLRFLSALKLINGWLLFFNMLPVYPLDGGQILRSLLWFALGAARSLWVTTLLGFACFGALVIYAVLNHRFDRGSIWLGVLALFLFSNCLSSFQYARALLAQERANKL